jgi:cardiolipin synthase A/B
MKTKSFFCLTILTTFALGLAFVWRVSSATTQPSSNTILLYALYFDPYLAGEPEEAFALLNVSGDGIDLSGWQVTDNEGAVIFPAYTLAPGEILWVTLTATSFEEEFGFVPAFEYGSDSDPSVPNLTGTVPTFANGGDEILLLDGGSTLIDALVYKAGNTGMVGWSGPAVVPYTQGFFGEEGQILSRKLAQDNSLPIADTDTQADWAQAADDDYDGKKVRYPGWDLEHYFFPYQTTETATLTYLIAPDNLFEAYVAEISAATDHIFIEGYSFTHAQIADALVARLQAGVEVTVLLEEEIVAGIPDQEQWVCQQIEVNGGQCWFIYNDSANGVHDRYTYQHAKFTLVDDLTLLTGSENLNGSSMPADDKSDGTRGNRGVYLITNAAGLIDHALDIWQHDFDPANHKDIRRWDALSDAPPPGFVPDYSTGGSAYAVQFPDPLVLKGTFSFELVQAPENTLREADSLLGMVARAGTNSLVLVEQLYEHPYWGPSDSDSVTDPNPRLEAYVQAARRGALVRILLDSFYDDPANPRGNLATCTYVNSLASNEALDLACLLGDPTGTGIHNKMVLVWDGAQGWTHTGSLNGSENSNKSNRELAVQVQSNAGYQYLAAMFDYDWVASGGTSIFPSATSTPTPTPTFTPPAQELFSFLPLILRALPTPTPTNPPLPTLSSSPTATNTPQPTNSPTITPTSPPAATGNVDITFIFFDGQGSQEPDEYVQIQNMDTVSIQLQGWTLSDAANHVFTFPNFFIQPGQVCRVYTNENHPEWCGFNYGSGSAIWNNTGDTASLRNSNGVLIDMYTY